MARSVQWLRRILRLLPPSFREEFGEDLFQAWHSELEEIPKDQAGEIWRRIIVDTVRVSPREYAFATGRNLKFAVRRLRRAPAFSLAVILTLAIGTGAAAAVFSLIDTVLLRPLPWRSPESVGLIWAVQPSGERTWLSFPEIQDLQRDVRGVRDVVGMTDLRLALDKGTASEEVQALAVSHGMLDLLGINLAVGRPFHPEDDQEGSAPVAILSDRLWRTEFGADPSILMKKITLNERRYSVIGVLPPSFSLLPASTVLPDRIDVLVCLEPHLPSRSRNVRFLHALARIDHGSNFSPADAELRAYGAATATKFPSAYVGGTWSFTIISFKEDVLRHAKASLLLLFGLVALVLLVACANVAHLLIGRGESRRREIAICTALGAAPARLAGELLAEGAVLALCGSTLGFICAALAPSFLRSIDANALPRLDESSLDWRIAVFMMGLTLIALVLSTAPAYIERLRVANQLSQLTTRSGGRTRTGTRLGKGLVIAQAALTTAVVSMAILLVQVLVGLHAVDLGLRTDRLFSARISLSGRYTGAASIAGFYERAIDRLKQVPGVTGAAAITQLPLSGTSLGSTFLSKERPEPKRIDADLRGVSPGYFSVAGTPLIEGREFTSFDSEDHPGVAIVDELFARRLSGNALGQRIRWFRDPEGELEIVGVVRAVRHRGPGEVADPTVYRPLRQYSRNSMFLIARSSQSSDSAISTLRSVLTTLDPSQPVADVSTLKQRQDRLLTTATTTMLVASGLAAIALILGSIGLYGVLNIGVSQRMREFGVRLSLGASPSSIRWGILLEGIQLSGLGAVIGILMTPVMERLFRVYGYDINASRLLPSAIALVGVVGSSMLALMRPAHRAAGADPMTALRNE